MYRDRFYTLAASCPDRSGIIARVTDFIAAHNGKGRCYGCIHP